MAEQDNTLSKFDRAYAGLLGGNALDTKPTTIEEVETVTGETETYIVQTIRDDKGDHVIVKFLDKHGPVRLILPPRVCATIAGQSARLAARRRVRVREQMAVDGRARARERMDRGEMPAFMRKRA